MSAIQKGTRIQIPVSVIEYDEGGNTMWVHGPNGCTVLRIQARFNHINSTVCDSNPCSHSDMAINGPINVCLHPSDVP